MIVRTPEELLAKLELQEENVPRYRVEIGATAEDIAEITRDKTILLYVDNRANVVEAGKKTTNGIKDHVFNGAENVAVVPYPVLPNDEPPVELVGGCLQRFRARNKRFKAAKGYTKEIGAAIGTEETADRVPPEAVIPTLIATAARSGYLVAVIVDNRGDSAMWKIFARRSGSEARQEIASGTGKTAEFNITPTTAGQPEKIELTVRLYKNNQSYGQESDSVYLTITP
ncbi:MAG: hypothetical protein LUM44_21120 [Pyrinomonadaceae bacterium]|nr:hypothetical protein [Pyrinomonadaceae bacterium]